MLVVLEHLKRHNSNAGNTASSPYRVPQSVDAKCDFGHFQGAGEAEKGRASPQIFWPSTAPTIKHIGRNIHTYIRLTALCPGLPRSAGTRKVKPICILLEQETVSGSGISWAICKSAPCSRQITTPAHHHSDLYRPDAPPAAQPTASKH